MNDSDSKSSNPFQSFQGEAKSDELPQVPLTKQKSAPTVKHINSSYGITFESEVDLFHPKHMANYQQDSPLNKLPEAQVIHKTYALLKRAINQSEKLSSLLKIFKEYDSEMRLKVSKLAPMEKSITVKGDKEEGEVKDANGEDSGEGKYSVHNTSIMGSLNLSKKHSAMHKSNKVEVVENIIVKGPKIAKHLSAIKSAESIESKQDFLTTEERLENDSGSTMDNLGMPPVLNKEADCSIELKSMEMDSRSWFSGESSQKDTLQNLKPPALPFNEESVETILSSRSPFLINLALCLFFKCVRRSDLQLTNDNVCWVLSIATIVAYKIFYDQTLQGIMDWYSEVLGRPVESVAGLERWFLGSVDYEVVVSNRQYQEMLLHLVAASDE